MLYEISKKNERLHEEVCKRIGEAIAKGDNKERIFYSRIASLTRKGVMMSHEETYHGFCPSCGKRMINHRAKYCENCGQLVDKETFEEYCD